MQYSIFSGGSGHNAFISDPLRTIPLKKLPVLPPFLRFDNVQYNYNWVGSRFCHVSRFCRVDLINQPLPLPFWPSDEKKRQKFLERLQSFKPALKDSNSVYFIGHIGDRLYIDFEDHFALLKYIRTELLSLCDLSRHYEFFIEFNKDKDSHTNVIESLLQMPQIRRSSVGIELIGVYDSQLPVEAIVQWLNQEPDPLDVIYRKKQQEKCLTIKLRSINNLLQMFRRLVEVPVSKN